MDALVRGLLAAGDPPRADTLEAWWSATAYRVQPFEHPIDRALIGGALADRLGFAFARGYAEALRALVPGSDGITALCATEEGGAHPRAIHTTLENGELTGKKKWATIASAASALLVVATTGTDDTGRPRLVVVRVPASAPGVHITATTAPFVPEIPHAEITLDRVKVEDVLPGDGYTEYLKPFRTVEDLHVHGALLGYLIGVARRHTWRAEVERLLALAAATRTLAAADPKQPTTHVALAGLLDLAAREVVAIEARWDAAPDDEWQRWLRDRPLLKTAAKARAARLDKAWQDLR